MQLLYLKMIDQAILPLASIIGKEKEGLDQFLVSYSRCPKQKNQAC